MEKKNYLHSILQIAHYYSELMHRRDLRCTSKQELPLELAHQLLNASQEMLSTKHQHVQSGLQTDSE